MIDPADTLRAGGLVPTTAELPAHERVDAVVARAYAHPALPGRVVIRLTAATTAAGDDGEMAALGFADGEARGTVAVQRRHALGFPGWALVHDPANARYALDVVRELQLAVRQIAARPGHARTAIEAIAERLGASVPQFLPAFYEQAGRAFLAHGGTRHAAELFGKARDAEAVHALAVDEAQRLESFLEFALAGAVTTRALARYARDLAAGPDPVAAYRYFFALCVQRTLGGVPPWAGMARELHRLARAAGLDIAGEDVALVRALLGAPALAHAGGELWRAYGPALLAVARADAAARRALIELFPSAPGVDDAWLALLEASGALDELAAHAAPAAWLDRLIQHATRRAPRSPLPPRIAELLRRLAPQLRAAGAPLRTTDLALIELALALGVEVEPGPIDLLAWARGPAPDPERAVADPRIGPRVIAAYAAVAGSTAFEAVARGAPALREVRRAWLEALIERAETGALPAVEELLATLRARVTSLAGLPVLHARLAALDVEAAHARTLRIGILDELGWPALEAAADELGAEAVVYGGPPAAVVANRARAIAVDAQQRLAEIDLVVPPHATLRALRWIDGALLVVVDDAGGTRAAWSTAPREWFAAPAAPARVARAEVRGDGAWVEAGAAIHAGDRVLALGDGPVLVGDRPGERPAVLSLATAAVAIHAARGTILLADPATGEVGSRIAPDLAYARGQVAALPATWFAALVPRAPDAPRLRAGRDGIAALARALADERDRLAAQLAPAAGPAPLRGGPSDAVLAAALATWIPRPLSRPGDAWQQIAEVGAWFRAADRRDRVAHVPACGVEWFELALAPGALGFVALAAEDPAVRAALVALQAHLLGELPAPPRLRRFVARAAPVPLAQVALRWEAGHAYVLRAQPGGYRVLEYAPDGAFVDPPDLIALDAVTGAPPPSLDERAELAAVVARGGSLFAPAHAAQLAGLTGHSAADAGYLLAGAPPPPASPELRARLGAPARELAAAHAAHLAIPVPARLALAARAMHAGAAALVSGRAIPALAAAWTAALGPRTAIPASLIARAERDLGSRPPPALALSLLVLAPPPSPTELPALARYLPFVAAELCVGEPLRAQVAATHARIVAYLADPATWLPAGEAWADAEVQQQLAAASLPAGVRITAAGELVRLEVQPAVLDEAAVRRAAHVFAAIPEAGFTPWRAARYLRSPGLAAIAQRIRATPVAPGGWEQAPAASAPSVVAEVAGALALSADAAALYLQHLVLLWPTPRALRRWNGWPAARLAAATDELVARGLLRIATRARAQRRHFLPGGWEALRAPHPPLETWKLPFYGAPTPPLGRFLALAPFHELFAAAAERIAAGDVPRYEEIKR